MENFDQYKKLTEEKNWNGICNLNGVVYDAFGTKKEFKVLPECLEDGEVVFAVTSGIIAQSETSNIFDFGVNTWIVVLTSARFLFIDCAMLTDSYDIQSVRHENVQAVSSSQGFILGKVIIDLGSRLINIDNCQKDSVTVFPKLANRWLETLKKESANQNSLSPNSISSEIEKLADLKERGILTEEEFATAKTKVLADNE